jgi:hypothetical protein
VNRESGKAVSGKATISKRGLAHFSGEREIRASTTPNENETSKESRIYVPECAPALKTQGILD